MLHFIAERLQSGNLLCDIGTLRQAADFYRAHAVQDDPRVHWYIDKNPNNFRYLNLISALFPQTRIIHCRHDQRDTPCPSGRRVSRIRSTPLPAISTASPTSSVTTTG